MAGGPPATGDLRAALPRWAGMAGSVPHPAAEAVAVAGLRQAGQVGALLAPAHRAGALVSQLRSAGWRRSGRSVCRYAGSNGSSSGGPNSGLVAVHISASATAALERVYGAGPGVKPCGHSISADALSLLPSGMAEWLQTEAQTGALWWAPGLRIGSTACGGPRGKQCNSALHSLRHTTAAVQAQATGAGSLPASDPSSTSTSNFHFIELFGGIGGFRLGLQALGGECVFSSEVDPLACATYHRNFGDIPHGDITELDATAIPDHDLLSAGFPCQSFSRAGPQAGLGAETGQLFFEVVRVLKHCRPKCFLLENVANLLTHDGGFTLAVVRLPTLHLASIQHSETHVPHIQID